MKDPPRTRVLPDQGKPLQADCHEQATKLQQLMLSMILFIGEVYVELAGHTAAARSVVQDMQSSASLLRSRSETPGPRPQPWLAASSPSRRASSGSQSSQDTCRDGRQGLDGGPSDPYAPPLQTRSTHVPAETSQPLPPVTPISAFNQQFPNPLGCSPKHTDPTSHPAQSILVSPLPLSPSTTSPPPGHLVRGLGGPSLVRQPYPLRRAPSPASAVGAPRRSPNSASLKPSSAAAVTTSATRQTNRASPNGDALHNPTDRTLPSAIHPNHQDPKSQNAGGMPGVSTPSSRHQHGSQGLRPPSVRHAVTERDASAVHQMQGSPAPPEPLLQHHARAQPPSDSMVSTPAVWSLPIPRAVDLTLSGGFPGSRAHVTSAGLLQPLLGPPSLPPALRRALALYHEAAAASKQLLQEARREKTDIHTSVLTPASLQQHVSDCGDSYVSRLNAHYGSKQQQQPGPTGSLGAQGAQHGGDGSGIEEDPQTLLAAIVAAQTWLMQALTELASHGGISSGVSTADIARLLEDVGAAQLRLRLSSASFQPQKQSPSQSAPQLPFSEAADNVKAAERWRNRFLRTLLDRNSPPGPSLSEGCCTAPFSTTMLRPVGLWLPDACWKSLADLLQCAPMASASVHDSSISSQPTNLRTWQQALPCGNSANTVTHDVVALSEGSARGALLTAGTPLPATALLCTSPHAAAAHARSQLQLQWHLCQLAWEGGPAASLVPTHQDCDMLRVPSSKHRAVSTERRSADSQPGVGSGQRHMSGSGRRSASGQLQQQQQQEQEQQEESEAAEREERWLARCRMAHMLLVKGAWNRHCCVSQMVEGDVAAEEERQ